MKRYKQLAFGLIVSALVGFIWSADLPYRRDRSYKADTAASEKTKPVRPDIIALQIPNNAIIQALADQVQASIPPGERCYTRYIWIPDAAIDSRRVTSLGLNYISRGEEIILPTVVADGHLLRVNLKMYCSTDADLHDWLHIWEEFAFDPAFAYLITKDNLDFEQKLLETFPVQEVVVSPAVVSPDREENRVITHSGGRYVYPDDSGRVHESLPAGSYTVDLKFKGRTTPPVTKKIGGINPNGKTVDVLRFNAQHINQEAFLRLQSLTVSAAPVVEYRYFLTRALSTIQDKGVFKQVFGGLYYQLRGIKKAKDVLGKDTKATDLDLFFDQLGIGNIKAGLTQEKLFDQLRSDQRLVVFRSDITGKPREVSSFHTPADREGGAWGAITGDIKDADIDIGDRSFANLLTPRRAAREAIFPTRTGFSIFGLFNGDGALQDEVPPDVAIDSTIPGPYTRRLQAAIGCIRCHGTDGSDGWKPLQNDAKTLLAGRLDNFGDLSQGRYSLSPQTINRLRGQFGGDFTKNLRRARDDVAEVTLRATGPWKESQATQSDVVRVAAKYLTDTYADYNYTMIDARRALIECGLDVEKTKAVEIFAKLVQVDTKIPAAIYLEDPRIGALKAGLSILRSDWALVYSIVMDRIQTNLKKEKIK